MKPLPPPHRKQNPAGSLFGEGFLTEAVAEFPEWKAVDDAEVRDLETSLGNIFRKFPAGAKPNESQTEDDLIWPVLARLGWTASLRQQNLSPRGMVDVPDGLLFTDEAAKDHANRFAEEWKRYGLGLAVVESKRWDRPLDRRSGAGGEETAPSTQMLRYLRRIDDLSDGGLRWGILTNGARWRLYHQGARSVSEQFFEIDLAALLAVPGRGGDLFALAEAERRRWLKVFALVFRRLAFLPGADDPRTFHRRAIDEGKFYEQRVAADLSDLVFGRVFPGLARAIATAAPEAPLADVREAALILLYRLLFLLYAEDRNLLPVRDRRYDDYALRKQRDDIRRRKNDGDTFSEYAALYWAAIDNLCRNIDAGDDSIGLPPYDGGLFDRERAPLLAAIRLGDEVIAEAIDALSFGQGTGERRYISYRDLGVQQLGSIYERLLEHEVARDSGGIVVQPNALARKGSGSYYTPDNLVVLVLDEAVEPLIEARMEEFEAQVRRLPGAGPDREHGIARLRENFDPAERLLELKVCDPAMGSGHFLVNLVDRLADRVIEAMAAAAAVDGYASPLTERIDRIRNTILDNARRNRWTLDEDRLDDRHIVRRMVLKRCVYGVDKNPMAVELAKVALWLHTFTVGAPLSFLDHHLRCGDSLFGAWVRTGIDKAAEYGSPLLLHDSVRRATRASTQMQVIEELTDAEIAEAHRSADTFTEVEKMTAPLNAVLSLVHALDWLDVRDKDGKTALQAFFGGQFGDPIDIALGKTEFPRRKREAKRFAELHGQAQRLIAEERFLNWQTAFPGVWSEWESAALHGGFDAVIGNPPWDRIRLEPVEWFAMRRREIALAQRATDRKRMVGRLRQQGDPLAAEFDNAAGRAENAGRMARAGGDYPLLAFGELNLYALFVERAMALVKPDGLVGFLTPSGIASDKTAARFFKGVATEGRLRALYDFENRRTRHSAPPFFPDVDSRFKFCAFVAGPRPAGKPARCAFFLQDVSELNDPRRCFSLTAADFARVNPNTGTAPIFRSRRDAELTSAIYGRLPVLIDRSSGDDVKNWPVRYTRMFDMSNDSGLFRTRKELEQQEGAWPIEGNRFASPTGDWLPLYEGKMVQAFDHRAASVTVNPGNVHRPAQPVPTTLEQHQDPGWLPDPQFWVLASECDWGTEPDWVLGFKEITAPTNMRTFIAALLPTVGFGNKIPILKPETADRAEWLLAGNLNSTILNFVARQKVQGQTLNLFIVEQLPIVPPDRYNSVRFGPKTAAEVVREAVLELTYTAHDMAPFARDMDCVDESGTPRPPFVWDEHRRLRSKRAAGEWQMFLCLSKTKYRSAPLQSQMAETPRE